MSPWAQPVSYPANVLSLLSLCGPVPSRHVHVPLGMKYMYSVVDRYNREQYILSFQSRTEKRHCSGHSASKTAVERQCKGSRTEVSLVCQRWHDGCLYTHANCYKWQCEHFSSASTHFLSMYNRDFILKAVYCASR